MATSSSSSPPAAVAPVAASKRVSCIVSAGVRDRPVMLFDSEWTARNAERHHPELVLSETAVGVVQSFGGDA